MKRLVYALLLALSLRAATDDAKAEKEVLAAMDAYKEACLLYTSDAADE